MEGEQEQRLAAVSVDSVKGILSNLVLASDQLPEINILSNNQTLGKNSSRILKSNTNSLRINTNVADVEVKRDSRKELMFKGISRHRGRSISFQRTSSAEELPDKPNLRESKTDKDEQTHQRIARGMRHKRSSSNMYNKRSSSNVSNSKSILDFRKLLVDSSSQNQIVNEMKKYLPTLVLYHCMETLVKSSVPHIPEETMGEFVRDFEASLGRDEYGFFNKYQNYIESIDESKIVSYLKKDSMVLKDCCLVMVDISGFTKLNESFAMELGKGGVEQVSLHLNRYLSRMIMIIERHGGDIIKFAGDALIVLFRNPIRSFHLPDGLQAYTPGQSNALRGVHCALQLERKAGTYKAGSVTLSIHIGIGFGDIYSMHLGGVNNQWELLLTGRPFAQLENTVSLSKSGDLVVSVECWEQIGDKCQGIPAKNSSNGEYLVLSMDNASLSKMLSVDMGYRPPLTPLLTCLLRCYVPACVLQKMEVGQLGYLAEHRRASVIFVNLRGLALNSKKSNDIVRYDEVLIAMQKVLLHNQGYRRQFLVDDKGSTFIAVFGVPPFAHEDDAYRSIKASMELQGILEELHVDHSIGIATGNVYVGSVGSSDIRKEHAVVGDTVNTAARLSGIAKPGEILSDASTFKYAGHKCSMEFYGVIYVKGKTEKLQVYQPISLDLFQVTITSSPSSTIGRSVETSMFLDTLTTTMNSNRTNVLWIEGEAGIGKTHLVNSFQHIASQNGIRCVYIDVDSIEKGTGLFLIKQIITKLLNITLKRGNEIIEEELRERLPLKVKHRIDTYMYILRELKDTGKELDAFQEHKLEKQSKTDIVRGYMMRFTNEKRSSEFERALEIAESVRKLIKHMNRLNRLMIVVDGIENIDNASIHVLNYVFSNVSGLLMIGTSRNINEHMSDIGDSFWEFFSKDFVSHKKLEGLGKDDILHIIEDRLQVDEFPDKILEEIMIRSHGNPLYSIEVVYALRDANIIVIDNRQCSIQDTDMKNVKLPYSLKKLVTQRLDGLPPDEQLVCKLGSLFGDKFPYDVLMILYMQECEDPVELDNVLVNLQNLEILKTVDDSKVYQFVNIQFQQACYDMLLFSKRSELHLEIAEWYKTNYIYSGNVNSYAKNAGNHYYKAIKNGDHKVKTMLDGLRYMAIAVDNDLGNQAYLECISMAYKSVHVIDSFRDLHILPKKLEKLMIYRDEFEMLSFEILVLGFLSVEHENVQKSTIKASKASFNDTFNVVDINALIRSTTRIRLDREEVIVNKLLSTILEITHGNVHIEDYMSYFAGLIRLWKHFLNKGNMEEALEVSNCIKLINKKRNAHYSTYQGKLLYIQRLRMESWVFNYNGRVQEAFDNCKEAYTILNTDRDLLDQSISLVTEKVDITANLGLLYWIMGFLVKARVHREQVNQLMLGNNSTADAMLKPQVAYYDILKVFLSPESNMKTQTLELMAISRTLNDISLENGLAVEPFIRNLKNIRSLDMNEAKPTGYLWQCMNTLLTLHSNLARSEDENFKIHFDEYWGVRFHFMEAWTEYFDLFAICVQILYVKGILLGISKRKLELDDMKHVLGKALHRIEDIYAISMKNGCLTICLCARIIECNLIEKACKQHPGVLENIKVSTLLQDLQGLANTISISDDLSLLEMYNSAKDTLTNMKG